MLLVYSDFTLKAVPFVTEGLNLNPSVTFFVRVIKPNPPEAKKGDYIVLRAEMNLVICLSACPQDITSICGNKPRTAHFEIY